MSRFASRRVTSVHDPLDPRLQQHAQRLVEIGLVSVAAGVLALVWPSVTVLVLAVILGVRRRSGGRGAVGHARRLALLEPVGGGRRWVRPVERLRERSPTSGSATT